MQPLPETPRTPESTPVSSPGDITPVHVRSSRRLQGLQPEHGLLPTPSRTMNVDPQSSAAAVAAAHQVDLEGWDLVGVASNAIVASLSDDGASPAIVSLLLGAKGFHNDPLVLAAEPFVQWLTTMADSYCNCVAATVCFDIVHEDLSEDDEDAGDEA
ncbi:hypothetical protein HPB50_021479 [Hyalomma asiaticum]|uniref:Uncharacterized protein n=1 Tax=Hyalomma asiaticum TaxID=266040 RepID=A0ACB7SM19_HYAAI|nr:hypothetical protein HPB50_021479 [Hyalomma asiaticum]